MAEQQLGNGALFSFTGTSGTTHTLLGVLSIDGPDAQRDTVDATLLGSTTPWRVFLKGDGDPGTLTLQCAYDNVEDTQVFLNAVIAGSTLSLFTITYNSSMDAETFQGYIVGRSRTIERNGMIQGAITIKVSSAPGFAVTT